MHVYQLTKHAIQLTKQFPFAFLSRRFCAPFAREGFAYFGMVDFGFCLNLQTAVFGEPPYMYKYINIVNVTEWAKHPRSRVCGIVAFAKQGTPRNDTCS